MNINLSDDLVKRLQVFSDECEGGRSIASLIEDVMDNYMDKYPWNSLADVCVHSEDCMHWKGVEQWQEEQK